MNGDAETVAHKHAQLRIDNFADWLDNEAISTGAPDHEIVGIIQPRSQNLSLGSASEEFLNTVSVSPSSQNDNMAGRVQQFSFNTPYAAPDGAACGRVAYSGFHVSAGSSDEICV